MAYEDMTFEGAYLETEQRAVMGRYHAGEKLEDIKPFKVARQRWMARKIAGLVGTNASVLEVGCGGSFLLHEADRLGLRCHGVDLFPVALEYSRALRAAYGSRVEITEADAFALPFADGTFDFVLSVGMIEHYGPADQVKLIREQARVARRFVDLSVPSEGPDSCIHHIVKEDEDSHLPTDLLGIAREAGLVDCELEGRGLFCPRFAAQGNSERYRRFIEERFPELWRDTFTGADIEPMLEAEATVSREDLLVYGSMHAVTGRVP